MPVSTQIPPRRLVILLHGIGGSGSTLMPIAQDWLRSWPDTRVVAPDAPFPHSRGYGRQWFALEDLQLMPERIEAIRHAFDRHLRQVVEMEGFDGRLRDIALVGVSQGAVVALDAVATGRWGVGALVSFAGLLPPVVIGGGAQRPPVLLVHGAEDHTIPAAASTAAARALRSAGFEVSLDILQGVGHTVTREGADLALRFLKGAMGERA